MNDERILDMIRSRPGIHTCELCRKLNGKWKYYCGRKLCFANPRKRSKFLIRKPDCELPLSTLRTALRRMIQKGLVVKKREKRPDGRNNRGWDWMQCYYVVESCLEKCGPEQLTGILLEDSEWLMKEQQLAKCDKCRAGGL